MAKKTQAAPAAAFDLEDLTLGELAEIEEATGLTLHGVDLANPPMKLMMAMLWIFLRRRNPEYTFENASKTTLRELQAELGNAVSPAAS